MISAAPVMIRAVDATPHVDRLASSSRRHVVALLDPAEQEHLVVHREAEQHREQEQRHPRLDRVRLLEAEETRADAVEEDEHEQPVRRADREQVEQRSRRARSTIERNATVSRMKLRPSTKRSTYGASGSPRRSSRCSPRSSPPTSTFASVPREGLAGRGRAQLAHRGDRARARPRRRERNAEHATVAVRRSCSVRRPNAGRRASSRASRAISPRTPGDAHSPIDDDPYRAPGSASGRRAAARGSPASTAASGSVADAVRADVQPEDRDGEREQQRRRDDEAERRPPHHARARSPPQKRPSSSARSMLPAEHRDPQPVDAVAEQAEQRRKQRQRRDHRGDPDEDRAEREAAHDSLGTSNIPSSATTNDRAAEEHRSARGRARARDRVVLLAPAARSSR